MTVSAFYGARAYLFCTWYVAGFGKNALTGDGCCWHAQHGLCHRTKNRITGLMLCPSTHGTRWAAYRHLSHVLIKLQLHRVSLSRHHVGRSRNATRVELCPNRRLEITWRSGGREGRCLLSSQSSVDVCYDTYSGTNGRLTPFVGVDLNAISLNLGSSAVAHKPE